MVKITRNKHKQLRQQRRKTKKQYGGTLEEEYGNEARERINNIIAIQDYMTSGQAEEKAEYETKMRELKQYHIDLIEFLEQNGNKSLLDTPIETQVIINTKPTKVRTIIFYLILYYVADMELAIKCIRKLYEKRANLNIKNWLT
jgi:hypothetical protein